MSKPVKRPTIEKMKKFEEYLECRCDVCERITMLHDIRVALMGAAICINPTVENFSSIVEFAELIEAADKLVDFHVAGHLATEFGLTIEEARHVVDYKNSIPSEEVDEDEIPF